MTSLYLIVLLLSVFFMICIAQINHLKKEVRKLNKIVKYLLDKE